MTATAGAETQSRGFTLKGALAFVEARWGADGRTSLISTLDPELRHVVEGTVLPASWYPFRLQVGLYEAIDRYFGSGDLALCWQIGRFTAEHELTTVHKLFLKLASLEHWFKSAGLMWRFYYSVGRLEVDMTTSSGEVRVVDFDPLHRAFCLDFGGWVERTIELSRKRDVVLAHTECVLVGGTSCVYAATWKG